MAQISNSIQVRLFKTVIVSAIAGLLLVNPVQGQNPAEGKDSPQSIEHRLLKPLSDIKFERLRSMSGNQLVPETRILDPQTRAQAKPTLKSKQWVNSNLCYRRLYFEEYCLERYGVSYWPHMQSEISGVRFFTTAVAFPFLPLVYSRYDQFRHRD